MALNIWIQKCRRGYGPCNLRRWRESKEVALMDVLDNELYEKMIAG